MVETPTTNTTTTTTASLSSSSSCASFSSFDDISVKSNGTVKFLCSYGGKILPRYPDGKLRYIGGVTRVLAVDRSIPYSELQSKLGELCGWGSVSLRCQLPTEDLDALISITSDEDLANLIEEYDLANREKINPLKIRAFLHESTAYSKSKSSSPTPSKSPSPVRSHRCVHHHQHHQHQVSSVPSGLYGRSPRDARFFDNYDHHRQQYHEQNKNYRYLVHN